MKYSKLLALITFLIFLGGIHPLAADNLPPSNDASVTGEKIKEEAQKKLETKPSKPVIEKELEEKKPAAQLEKSFFVREIALEGNQAISTADLLPIVVPYEGREVTLNKLNELAGKIEQQYRLKGYVTTLAYIPPQKVENQRLILRVMEGKVRKLYIEGNKWFSKWAIRRYWHFKEGEILYYNKMSHNLRRMNETPDRQVRGILRPGEKTGTTDVYLKVTDHFPGHASFQFDNQGVRSTGKRRFGFAAHYNNFVIPDSIMYVGTVFGRNFGSIFAQYMVPVNSYGTKLIFSFSHSQVAPKKEFKSSDINSISQSYFVSLRQVLYEGDHLISNASLGYDFKDSTTHDTTGTRRRDRLRILRPGLDLTYYDRWGITTFNEDTSFGTKLFGASSENNALAGRQSARPDFVKFENTLTRLVNFPYRTSLVAKISSQVSTAKLTPQEEFYLGGANTVRGYPEGDYLGDQGVLLNIEYTVPFFFLPHDWQLPHSNQPLQKDCQFVFFFDEGYARLRGPAITETPKRHLMGAGAGVRIHFTKFLTANLSVAHVLGDEPLTDSDHTRFHFTLQTEV